jgi:hypothetical protein
LSFSHCSIGDFPIDRSDDFLRSAAGRGHLTADGAQFAHDLAMHRADIGIGDGGHWHVAGNCFFDTKTSAMNRHEALPELHSFRLSRRDLTLSSHRNRLRGCAPVPRTPAINHARPAFIENKRYRTKRSAIDDVVNLNAVSVYQTD